ncbi:hypothetical protein E2C01_050255 [Portunus trituberculatus]|uniref:Uncharacterized protein n=1 Tax=Portunus trituberculatus TaxID=210409 RepID=A0A5B7GBK8_PORTR|nr:hypothetical protein [Portunus trituberculatus]
MVLRGAYPPPRQSPYYRQSGGRTSRGGCAQSRVLPGDKISGHAPRPFWNTRFSPLSTCHKVEFSTLGGAPQRRHSPLTTKQREGPAATSVSCTGACSPHWHHRPAAVLEKPGRGGASSGGTGDLIGGEGLRVGHGTPLSPLLTVHKGEFGASGRPRGRAGQSQRGCGWSVAAGDSHPYEPSLRASFAFRGGSLLGRHAPNGPLNKRKALEGDGVHAISGTPEAATRGLGGEYLDEAGR